MNGRKHVGYSLVLLPYLLSVSLIADNAVVENKTRVVQSRSYDGTNITADGGGIRMTKSDKESSQSLSVSPQAESIKSNYSYTQRGLLQVDVGAFYEANNVSDTVLLDASLRLLYAGAKMGTYIGVTKGSDLEKFIVSEGFALNNGRIKLSAALLKRLTHLDFSEYSKTYDETLTQRSLSAEYSYLFGGEALLNELKTSLSYYDIDGKDLGRISDIIIDNASYYDWTQVYGGYRGGSKLLAEMSAVFRVTDSIRATFGVGYDKVSYDAMYDAAKESSTKLSSKSILEYRLNDYNQLELYGSNQNTQSLYGGKYTHDFGNTFRGFVSAEQISREYAPDDTQYRFGLNYTFGADNQHSKLNPLFASNNVKSSLTLSELTPISSINTNNFAFSPKKVTKTEHIAFVDKTALNAGDGINLNSDGTLANIYFDNDGFSVNSIDSVNDSTYLPYLGVVGGKLAVINIFALNAHMASQGLITGETKMLNIAVSDTSGVSVYQITITKGSAKFNSSKKSIKGVGTTVAQAFVQNTLDSQIASDFINGLLSASVIDKILDGTISPFQVEQYKAGALTVTDLENIKPIADLITEKNTVLANLPSASLLTGATTPSTELTAYNTAKVQLEAATTQAEIESAITAYNTAVNNLNSAITQANTTYNNTLLTQAQAQKAQALAQLPTSLLSGATAPDAAAYNAARAGLEAATTPEAIARAITAYNTALSSYNTAITTANTTYTNSLPPPPPPEAQVVPVMGNVTNLTVANGGAVNIDISSFVTLTNGDAITAYTLGGDALPAGLSFNTTTGALTGSSTATGTYNFTVTATDNDGVSNTDSFSITINAVPNTAPTALDATLSGVGTGIVIDISSIISDSEQADALLTLSTVSGPTHGTLSWAGQTFTYTPNAGYEGSDSFTYKVNDGTNDSLTKTITLNGIDTVNPTAGITYGTTGPTNGDVEATVTLTDTSGGGAAPAGWTKNGNEYTKTYSTNVNENVTFTDAAGNEVSRNVTITNIDNTGPSKTGESIANLNTQGGSFTGTMTFDENVVSVDSISFVGGGGSVSVTGGIGTQTLTISGTAPHTDTAKITITTLDNLSNSGAEQSAEFPLGLKTPTGLNIVGATLSWDAVPGANTYYITDDEDLELSGPGTSVDISSLSAGIITVVAESSTGTQSSPASITK